jgi:hypothetical protein
MATPTIKAGGMLSSHYLEVTFLGVRCNDPNTISFGVQKHGFSKIDCVLLSSTHELSFQVGKDIFRIPTKPADPKHQEAIAALLAGIERNSV